MKHIVISEINNFVNERKYNQRINDFLRVNEIFNSHNVNESDDLSNNVIDLINSDQWEEQDSKRFKDSLSLSKHQLMLSDYTEAELSQMKLFKLDGYNIGYALKYHDGKPFSEVVAVHNNEPTIRGIGDILMQSAIKNGACYLDHFDTLKLTSLYKNNGFIEYDRIPYDPQYDPQGIFKRMYGELDVVFRKYSGC